MDWPAAVARLTTLFSDTELRGKVTGRLAMQSDFERFFTGGDNETRAALLQLAGMHGFEEEGCWACSIDWISKSCSLTQVLSAANK